MCRARARPSNSQRHPSRKVRPPCGFKSTRRKSLSTWFLLADCLRRGQGIGPKMQRVPEVQLQAAPAGFCTQDHPHCLGFRSLGSRHGGAIQDGTRWLNSLTCRSGQVHQVDRSEANQEIEWSDCRDFHLRYQNSVRNTTQHHHRQRHKFCQRRLGTFLRNTGHPTGPSVHRPSTVKRLGGVSKRSHPVRHQAPAGRASGALGWLLA